MLPYSQKLKYKDVFGGVQTAATTSQVILAKDFPVVEFTLYVGLTADLSDVVGTFEVGEIVSGGSSGAVGEIYSFTSNSIVLINVDGTFQNHEDITGGTSGATADIDSPTVPDFVIKAFTSEQSSINGVDNPPDPSLPSGPDNDYTQVVYSDEETGTNYDVDNPFNPTVSSVTSYTPKKFRLGTDGQSISGKWVFLQIAAAPESSVGGALLDSDIIVSNL